MKKILIALFVLPLIFACSSDDNKDDLGLQFIQFFAKYDSTVETSYQVYVYKGDLADYKNIYSGFGDVLAHAENLDGETVFPINVKDGKMKVYSSNNGYAVHSIYPKKYELSPDSRYTIQFIINIYGKGNYSCVKSFDIDRNSVIRLKFNDITDFTNKKVDGDWQIVDATQSGFRELIDFK